MKEKIITALKTKFTGVKDEIIDRIATKAAKTITTDDELNTYIEGVTIQTIIDAEGDRRATDAQKTAVANYEKKHNLKEGKVIEQPKKEEPKEVDPDTPAWAKELIQTQKALNDRIAAMEGEKVVNTRKAKLNDLLKDAPEDVRKMYESNFDNMQFKDDETFDSFMESTKSVVDAISTVYKAKGAIVTPPKNGGNIPQKGEVNATLKAMVEEAKAAPAVQMMGGGSIMGMPSTPAAK